MYFIFIQYLFYFLHFIVGAVFAGMNDMEFNFAGYFWMAVNCVCTSGNF